MRQIAGEELDIPLERIAMVEGDTALTPNQGPTAGSYGIARGGHAAPPGGGHRAPGAPRPRPPSASGGRGRPRRSPMAWSGEGRRRLGHLWRADRRARFNLPVDEKAPRKAPARFRFVGKPLPRPGRPAEGDGATTAIPHDLGCPARSTPGSSARPPSAPPLAAVDESSSPASAGRASCACRASSPSSPSASGSGPRGADAASRRGPRARCLPRSRKLVRGDAGEPGRPRPGDRQARRSLRADRAGPGHARLRDLYRWPIQTHGSIGPSCGVADCAPTGAPAGARPRTSTASSPRARGCSASSATACADLPGWRRLYGLMAPTTRRRRRRYCPRQWAGPSACSGAARRSTAST